MAIKTILTNDAETAPISHLAATDSSTDEEYVFVTKDAEGRELPVRSVTIAGESTDVLVDSGASANLLDGKAYSVLKTKLKLEQSSKIIYPYGAKTPSPFMAKPPQRSLLMDEQLRQHSTSLKETTAHCWAMPLQLHWDSYMWYTALSQFHRTCLKQTNCSCNIQVSPQA